MKDLFSGFDPATPAQWKERIIRDLKGEAFENLIWKNENGFDVFPFYTSEDVKAKTDPAFYHSNWEICASSLETSSSGINRDLLYQLNKGATAILVDSGRHNYENLLRDINLEMITSTFFCTVENFEALSKFLDKNYKGTDLKINFFSGTQLKKDEPVNWLSETNKVSGPNIRRTCINALDWFNQGALPYYELALTMAYLVEWMEAGIVVGAPQNSPVIRTGIDCDLFVQIAKLRALRRLWEVLKPEFNCQAGLYIIAETSLSNKSVADQYNNLLRSSVESFGAIAGGCNELVVHNFDALSGKPNKTATRLALNQQHILKEEAYLDKMGDVGCGSYYIESLTDQLALRALASFKEIMASGGYSHCVASGSIQKEIDKQYSDRKEKIKSGEQVVVGVNKFKNEKEAHSYEGIGEALRERSIRNPGLDIEQQQNLKKV
jgi:methylmalonyl-CoA mutase